MRRTIWTAAQGAALFVATVALAASIVLGCRTPSPLYQAAYRGDVAGVERRIAEGADPNAIDEVTGWQPLLIAAAEGHAPAVSALLEAGADVNARNYLGRTALMYAANYGYTHVLEVLLARGADPNVVPRAEPRMTALTAAAKAGNVGAVRLLLAHDADPSIRDETGRDAAAWAQESGHDEVVQILREAAR